MAATEELGGPSRRQSIGRRRRRDGEFKTDRFVEHFEIEVAWQNSEYEDVEVDPQHPTHARPGSEEKVRMMAARYASGLPLWHQQDCADHGSGGGDSIGLRVADLLTAKFAQPNDHSHADGESGAGLFS